MLKSFSRTRGLFFNLDTQRLLPWQQLSFLGHEALEKKQKKNNSIVDVEN